MNTQQHTILVPYPAIPFAANQPNLPPSAAILFKQLQRMRGARKLTSDSAGTTKYSSILGRCCTAKIDTGTRPTRDVAAVQINRKDTRIHICMIRFFMKHKMPHKITFRYMQTFFIVLLLSLMSILIRDPSQPSV